MAATSKPRRTPADARLQQQLSELQTLERHALLAEYRRVRRGDPPPRLSDSSLRLAIAYRLQEQRYDGLPPALRKALLSNGAAPVQATAPGTLLIREWHGQQHSVLVHADRVEYAGQSYRSLTEVALKITGQKRSGPAFFGLRSKPHG